MRALTLPGTTLTVSALCLGTAEFGAAIPRVEAFHLLDAYTAGGGNFIDTAKVYADWRPGERSIGEKTIGAWLRERGSAFRGGVYADPLNQTRYARLRELRARTGLSLTQLAPGYLMAQPFPTVPVIGPASPAQLADSMTAADVALAAADVAYLAADR